MVAQGLDAQTLHAVIKLQLDELELLGRSSKGKGREGEAAADFDLALELYKAEVASCAMVLADSSMCRSIARAVSLDRPAIDEAAREELQERRDREVALRLAGQSRHSQHADESNLKPDQDSVGPDEELIRRLAILYMTPDDDGGGTPNQPESSSWAQSRNPSTPPIPTTECISCGDAHPAADVAHCPCSHYYCRGCLASLFRASMQDEALFPPRCCREPIPLDPNRKFLAAELAGQFQAKKIEFETKDRTYCHQPECSTFVPPQFIHGDVATCVSCQCKTCAICKGASHVGDCPQDEAAQQVLRLAQANGWQRCYSCRRVVELDHGCNHMTCLCGAHFCYSCGLRWKTCRCEQWNEDRLYARAAAIVNRDAGAPGLGARRHERLVQQEMQNQRRNHACEDHDWTFRRGAHRCEECRSRLPEFIFECRGCRIMVCRRCRYNRL